MLVKHGRLRHATAMNDDKDKRTREERLAAKLRENLRRRKAQARELGAADKAALPKDEPNS